MLIAKGIPQGERLQQLNQIGRSQITSLIDLKTLKGIAK